MWLTEGTNRPIIAKTLFGLEEVLAKELQSMGAQDVEKGNRLVKFKGDLGFLYKANLNARTALRFLVPIAEFQIRSEDHLYKQLRKLEWSEYMTQHQTMVIDAQVHSRQYRNSMFMALKCKDAIADYFRDNTGKRPDVDKENPDVRFHLHIQDRFVTLSLDSSGESLHKRGYRQMTNAAPINEVLAAGILKLTGWTEHGTLMDPMCGSGTLLIEAALMAHNIPANIFREEFAFERWENFDENLWDKIREISLNKEKNFHGQILGRDKAPSAIQKAIYNVEKALFEGIIDIEAGDFFRSPKPAEKGTIIFNPPYGERLPHAEDFYSKIGDRLKKEYQGYEAWIISSDLEAVKSIGLRPSRRIKLFNGSLECKLLKYEMYSGSKKAKFQGQED